MRQLLIPAEVFIPSTYYAVEVPFYQDNTISTIASRMPDTDPVTVDFTERVEGFATLDQAKNWIKNQVVFTAT